MGHREGGGQGQARQRRCTRVDPPPADAAARLAGLTLRDRRVKTDLLFDPSAPRGPMCTKRPGGRGRGLRRGVALRPSGRVRARREPGARSVDDLDGDRRHGAPDRHRPDGPQRGQPPRGDPGGDGGHPAGGQRGPAAARSRCRRWPRDARTRRSSGPSTGRCRATRRGVGGGSGGGDAAVRVVGHCGRGRRIPSPRPPTAGHHRRLRAENGRTGRSCSRWGESAGGPNWPRLLETARAASPRRRDPSRSSSRVLGLRRRRSNGWRLSVWTGWSPSWVRPRRTGCGVWRPVGAQRRR